MIDGVSNFIQFKCHLIIYLRQQISYTIYDGPNSNSLITKLTKHKLHKICNIVNLYIQKLYIPIKIFQFCFHFIYICIAKIIKITVV
jgi:hypothetical protein